MILRGDNMSDNKWYVLRSKPHKERSLYKYATQNKHEVFYPTIPVNPVNPRASKIRSYFPGYMFLNTDINKLGKSAFHWMPFSQGLVRIGSEAASVPENIITSLQHRVAEIWQAGGMKLDEFVKGDHVIINQGSFDGYRAIYDVRIAGTERVRVLLEMLSDRFVPMELDVGLLEKVGQRQ
jgi:transcriptional antiterminator RfaH